MTPPLEDEQAWIERAREGDESAFRELVKRYDRRIYGIVVNVRGLGEDVKDVYQDTLLNIWKGLPSFKGRSSFSTWVYRLTLNAALDVVRHPRVETTSLEDFHESSASRDSDSFEGDEAVSLRNLRQAIEHLAPKQKSVVVLHVYERLSYPQIAEVMECSEGTVKAQLHHARRHLREILFRAESRQGD